jgi:hypothetical protein
MPAWWTWFTVGDIAVPKLMAQESLALVGTVPSLAEVRDMLSGDGLIPG